MVQKGRAFALPFLFLGRHMKYLRESHLDTQQRGCITALAEVCHHWLNYCEFIGDPTVNAGVREAGRAGVERIMRFLMHGKKDVPKFADIESFLGDMMELRDTLAEQLKEHPIPKPNPPIPGKGLSVYMVQRVEDTIITADRTLSYYQAMLPDEDGRQLYAEFQQSFCERLLPNYRDNVQASLALKEFPVPEIRSRRGVQRT